ncbi:hypothetical protein QUH73_09875 [Labilibaculum sp. K2S]|uniref:hypothetical protein n=1 Tax=Labilibaculum sp. K2S TaxID=3056386 RepID=UPI0025A41ABC|nr:hypothetical protein [Labilibaculum sp. K2S]MDM8160120.1 hypothetical protein [Labilibaculum sp. K2S]
MLIFFSLICISAFSAQVDSINTTQNHRAYTIQWLLNSNADTNQLSSENIKYFSIEKATIALDSLSANISRLKTYHKDKNWFLRTYYTVAGAGKYLYKIPAIYIPIIWLFFLICSSVLLVVSVIRYLYPMKLPDPRDPFLISYEVSRAQSNAYSEDDFDMFEDDPNEEDTDN